MSDNSFISIRNATIASVIAGVILLTVPTLRSYVVSFLTWAWSGIIWGWEVLIGSYSLPGWAWLLIFIFALIGLINIYGAIKGESEELEFKSYVEDFIYGAKWRWNWLGNNISNLWCFCPSCDATLVYDDSSCSSFSSDVSKTDFICENCNRRVVASISGGNNKYATGAVEREVGRRIRTGEYKKP